MQLQSLKVEGLFGHFDHEIPFPTRTEEDATPSIVIIYGPNGVGKTTLLKMLSGLMTLNFDTFRQVPFDQCSLEFTTGETIIVKRNRVRNRVRGLEVSFSDKTVVLTPRLGEKGAAKTEDREVVEEFRRLFFDRTDSVHYDFIDTTRSQVSSEPRDMEAVLLPSGEVELIPRFTMHGSAIHRRSERPLASRVQQFVSSAQLDYRRYFAIEQPDLFSRILQGLHRSESPRYDAKDLLETLRGIRKQEDENSRLGIEHEQWDLDEIASFLAPTKPKRKVPQESLIVVGAYTEVLATRARERQLVADRLLTFERLLANFLLDKRVAVDQRQGFRILTVEGRELSENQLSSGEYHLLYLLVSALVTRRRGTVIAIDEPEMSMHVAWQRRLIPSLFECVANAAPQFVFATHSPEIVGEYTDALVELPTEQPL